MQCTDALRYFGRETTFQFDAALCPADDPAGATLVPLGAVTTKSINMNGNTVSANDDLSSGFDETMVSTTTLEISLSGNALKSDGTSANLNALRSARFASVVSNLGQQPVIWGVYTTPSFTISGYFNVVNFNEDNPDSELSTYTIDLQLAPTQGFPPVYAAA